MPANTVNRLLKQLEEAKGSFGGRERTSLGKILASLQRRSFTDTNSLIRFHELLLFIRAYPHDAKLLRQVEVTLKSFANRVDILRDSGEELSPLDQPEVSGITGTCVTDTFSYHIVRWLLRRHPSQVTFDWDWFEDENRLAAAWPRFMPLLEEDVFVEANVPYLKWLHAAKGELGHDLQWLVQRFESLPIRNQERAELYDSLKLYVRWTPQYRATRTGMKLPVSKVFYHRQPLIQRRDISFRDELQAPPATLKRLSARHGAAMLDMARETSTLRYRELYGFTHGDPRRVLKVSIGRGVDLFVIRLPRERRLPLRAYHAAMIFKNGVPIGYFEGLSLFERMESGFNFYYGFRDGETAWIYARTLNCFRHLLGVTVFTLDPYQIGYENEEGIDSGAFWFYRKLGFRPTLPGLLKLALAEERRIATRPSYRTPKSVLRQLATGPMIFEMDHSQTGDWDRFQVRNIGFAAQRHMAAHFNGVAEELQKKAVEEVTHVLGMHVRDWRPVQQSALCDLAVALFLVPNLSYWTAAEKQHVIKIIGAKAGADEARYLKLAQKHGRLRREIIKLGSKV